MMQKIAAFILITILINACCASETTSVTKGTFQAYKNFAESKLGGSCKIILNSDSAYYAAYSSGKSSEAGSEAPLKFFIYDTKEEKILLEDNLPNGEIEWINENQLKVSTTPGIVSGRDDKNKHAFGYVYDVKQKRKLFPEHEIKKQ